MAGEYSSQNGEDPLAEAAVDGRMAGDDREGWAELPGLPERRPRPDAVLPRLVACRCHDTGPHGNRLPGEPRVPERLHRGEEGIHVDVKDAGSHVDLQSSRGMRSEKEPPRRKVLSPVFPAVVRAERKEGVAPPRRLALAGGEPVARRVESAFRNETPPARESLERREMWSIHRPVGRTSTGRPCARRLGRAKHYGAQPSIPEQVLELPHGIALLVTDLKNFSAVHRE